MSTVNIPKVGPVDKRVVYGVGAGAVAFVAWSWYRSRGAADQAATDPAATSDFGTDGTVPEVLGAVPSDNSFGRSDTTTDTTQTGVDSFGFTGTTNAQWSQYVVNQLVASDKWSYTDIVAALGAFLAGRPLDTLSQSIVQAAIALGGSPPVGTPTIIPGGNTAITVAPTGVKGTATANSVTLTASPVSGAAAYRAFRSGMVGDVGTATAPSITVGGLRPNTSYTFTVAAVSSAGKVGPRSAAVTVKTKAITIGRPTQPRVSSITRTSAHFTTGRVTGADGYNWYVNNALRGRTDAPAWTATGLKPNTTYTVTVAADTTTQAPGPKSPGTPFRTKR